MSLELAFVEHGQRGPPIVILHGLFGSSRNWATIARRLADEHRVFTLDLRNHGASPWAERMTYDDMADDVAAFIQRHGLSPATVMGHSMGGKVAMRLALARSGLVARLIVIDVAPVTYRHSLGEYVEAMREARITGTNRRQDVDAQLQRVIPDPAVRAFLLQNLVRTEQGFAWRVNLDAIAANLPVLMGFPSDAGQSYGGPTLFLRGGRSSYVRPEHRPVIEKLFAKVELVTIADAGHRVHAEKPETFLAVVRRFLDRTREAA